MVGGRVLPVSATRERRPRGLRTHTRDKIKKIKNTLFVLMEKSVIFVFFFSGGMLLFRRAHPEQTPTAVVIFSPRHSSVASDETALFVRAAQLPTSVTPLVGGQAKQELLRKN